MKTCTYCGRENTDDATGCRECGTPFVTEPENLQASELSASGNPARTTAEKRMLYGALWCLGGILMTALTYSAAANGPSGGPYVIAWGAIIFGALRFFQGLSGRDTRNYELAHGTKLEKEGRVREALLVYQRFVEKYPHTDAARDAKNRIEIIHARHAGRYTAHATLMEKNCTEDSDKMKTIAYDRTKVLCLTKDGLEYLDDEASKRFIDFITCHKNFAAKMPFEAGKEPKVVAFRDLGAKPPHITFLTDPPTRFEFPMPKESKMISGAKFLQRDPEDFRDFREFHNQLFEVGVTTGDLS